MSRRAKRRRRRGSAGRARFTAGVGSADRRGDENDLAQFGVWMTVIQGAVFVACVLTFRRGIVGELAARARVSL